MQIWGTHCAQWCFLTFFPQSNDNNINNKKSGQPTHTLCIFHFSYELRVAAFFLHFFSHAPRHNRIFFLQLSVLQLPTQHKFGKILELDHTHSKTTSHSPVFCFYFL